MSISSVARTGYTAHHDGRSSRTSSPLSFVGVTAIACVTLACGWTLYSNVFSSNPFGAGYELASRDARIVFVAASPGLDQKTFTDRFTAPTVTATADDLPVLTVEQKNYAALMDVTHSLGAPPAAFKPTVVEAPDTPKPAPSRAEIARAPDVALPPPAPVRVANVPLPSARPSDFKFAKNKTAPNHIGMVERAKNAALAAMAAKTPSLFDKLFGRTAPGPVLAYAGSDGGVMSDGTSVTPAGSSEDDRLTAIYDITARTVYMPDGSKLEAHSGLGEKLDDPRHVNVRMHGATPPHIYDLKPREALFHGVAALRLTPVGGEGAIFGRTGLLAHTYMLGPNGDSNGCVSFKDYNAFLKAYRNGDVKRLVVVAKL
jgi:hypothetical protein